jgi:hypothetical protein
MSEVTGGHNLPGTGLHRQRTARFVHIMIVHLPPLEFLPLSMDVGRA